MFIHNMLSYEDNKTTITPYYQKTQVDLADTKPPTIVPSSMQWDKSHIRKGTASIHSGSKWTQDQICRIAAVN